ncbi:alpha-1,4-N-acetylglucosaminyltransferase-like [Hyposmocoma kahamanoa]|uniref:alpha-1,4-N-acetylglucosaminyltransferase-like n=1 Tax=Hyposmocoma kahamanoa TaxID=1477025 RepID=UPI000E6D72ED|nr:alpha-1,4-N-acetylglucosaminyltransferase-like [Hyposmocoma kahamanoa]
MAQQRTNQKSVGDPLPIVQNNYTQSVSLVEKILRFRVPDDYCNRRRGGGGQPLLATEPSRTELHRHSPIPRTTARLNSLLAASPQCDVFVTGIERLMTEWKRVLERCMNELIVVGLAIVFLWVYANGANGVNGVNGYNKYEDIISCYNNELEDDLPQMENHRFNSTKKHIYFHETTCNGSLGPRQACVVESAARFHPDWQINIAFSAPMNMSSRANLNPFQGFSNVKFWRVNILKYVKNTPVEYLITRHYLNKSYDAVRHAADILRLVTLYKWDGVYLDLDALLVKPLYDLERNFVTRENDYSVSTGLLSFSNDSAGRSIAKEVLWELATTFNPKLFVYNGPGLMTRKFEMYCNTNNFSQMTMPTCKVVVLSSSG